MASKDSQVRQLLSNLSSEQLSSILELLKETTEENVNSGDSETTGNSTQQQQNQETPLVSIQNIVKLMNELQGLALIIGNKQQNLKNWLGSVQSLLKSYHEELKQCESHLNEEFVNSLDTIAKIFKILKCYQNEFKDGSLVSKKVEKLIDDYRLNRFLGLSHYCDENETMSQLNTEIESTILKMKPILVDKILAISSKLGDFYGSVELIDDYNNTEFLSEIPSKEETVRFSIIGEVDDIKEIMATKFSRASPSFLSKIETEIAKVNILINERVCEVNEVIRELNELTRELDLKIDDLDTTLYEANEEVTQKIGVKTSTINRYKAKLDELRAVKTDRNTTKNDCVARVEELWAVLRPNDSSIHEFLKQNNNLKLSSVTNFELLVSELEQEKRANISKFIESSRVRIFGFWDLLMYDEADRQQFEPFYVEDPALFDEALLDLHNQEISRLREEVENLKPLLQMISRLNQLLRDKEDLDEASKDPNRLLKRDSFKILRLEEKTRDRLSKQLPATIDELKQQLFEYESVRGKPFRVNGELYVAQLNEIESELTRKRTIKKSPIKVLASRQTTVASKRSTVNSKRPFSVTRTTSRPQTTLKNRLTRTNTGSIIRRRCPADMTNPFNSKESSPVRERPKSAQIVRLEPEEIEGLQPVEPPVFCKRAKPAASLSFGTSQKHSLELISGCTISNKPIVIKGGSPMRKQEATRASAMRIPTLTPQTTMSMIPRAQTQFKAARLSPERPSWSPNKTIPTKRGFPVRVPAVRSGSAELKPLNFNLNLNVSSPNSTRANSPASSPRGFQTERRETCVAELSDSMIDYSEEGTRESMSKENLIPYGKFDGLENGKVLEEVRGGGGGLDSPRRVLGDISVNWETETF